MIVYFFYIFLVKNLFSFYIITVFLRKNWISTRLTKSILRRSMRKEMYGFLDKNLRKRTIHCTFIELTHYSALSTGWVITLQTVESRIKEDRTLNIPLSESNTQHKDIEIIFGAQQRTNQNKLKCINDGYRFLNRYIYYGQDRTPDVSTFEFYLKWI